jgi:hypothetical protein
MRHIPPAYQTTVLGIAVRNMYEGRLSSHVSMTAAPTAGSWAQGDVVRNSNPTKVTGGAFNYVVFGYICTVAGTPGTWEEMRIPCA